MLDSGNAQPLGGVILTSMMAIMIGGPSCRDRFTNVIKVVTVVAMLLAGSIAGHLPALVRAGHYVVRADTAAAPTTALVSLTNDYYSRIKTHNKWQKFPVTVYFVRDSQYTAAREQEARLGFGRWTEATHGYVSYRVVDSAKAAGMTVTFNPNSDDGHTTTAFTGARLFKAKIKVGVRQGWAHDIVCVAAHEFGHALGINGHSDRVEDLMFPTHNMGTAWHITQRDLNTLAAIYRPATAELRTWTPVAG
jgi:hypothetical protein